MIEVTPEKTAMALALARMIFHPAKADRGEI